MRGYSFEYRDYNHYDRHFEFRLGPLDSGEELENAAKAISFAKEEFDGLRRDFEYSTGQSDIMLYFHGSFTIDGEEHFGMFRISMGENETWNLDYPFDDYEACLRDCIEKIGK